MVNTAICICATINCTASYNSCVASVDAMRASNTAPPSLPQNILPTLTNRIYCYEDTSFLSYPYYNITSLYYLCMASYLYPGIYLGANKTMCEEYFTNHTVMCNIYTFQYSLSSLYSGMGRSSVGIEEYQPWLSSDLSNYMMYKNGFYNFTSAINYTFRVHETPTSVLHYRSYALGCNLYKYCNCYCTTNYCNVNITACTAGSNIDCNIDNTTIIGSLACQNASSTTNNTTNIGTSPVSIM